MIFFLNYVFRSGFILLFFYPNQYLQYLPYQNIVRAEQFVNNAIVSFPDAWSSYYLFVGFFYKLLQFVHLYEYRVMLIVVVNIFLGSLCSVLVYAIAKKTAYARYALFSTIIFSLYFPLIYFHALNISENFFCFTLLVSIYFLIQQRKYSYIFTGIFLGISVIIRPIILPFFFFLMIWIWWKSAEFLMRVKNLFLVFLPVIILIIWSNWINAEISNHKNWGFGAIGGVNFALAQCDLKKIGYRTDEGTFWFAPPVQFYTAKDSLETTTPFSNAGFYYAIGFHCLKNNPKQLITDITHIKNVFFSTLYPNFLTEPWQLYIRYCFQWTTCIMFVFYCMSVFVLKKKDYLYWLLWGLIISFLFSMYWANPGEERYMIPYFFVLTLYAVPTAKYLLLSCKTKSISSIIKIYETRKRSGGKR